jgi:hypothetical protein
MYSTRNFTRTSLNFIGAHQTMNALISRIRPMAAMVALAIVGSATAADVDMTGWVTYGGIATTTNTSTTIAVPAGSSGVSALSFSNLSFTAINGSYQSEFVIRVEVPGSTTAFWSIKPSSTAASGTFTGSGTGTTFAGAPFTIPAGTSSLRVFVYESFNDGGDTVVDANVTSGTLTVTFGNPPPPFDACAGATTGTIGDNTLPMSSTAANLNLACGPLAAAANKANYLKFVAPSTGNFTASNCAQTADTVMGALTVCGDPASALTCNDDLCGLASSINFFANQGDTIYIAVGMYSTTATPPATMPVNIAEAAPPFDACAAPPTAVVGDNVLTMNPGAADLDISWAGVVVYKCNYLTITPTQDGLYTFSNCADADFDSWIITTTVCGDGNAVEFGNDDGCGTIAGPSSLQVSLLAGVTYYIGVGAYGATDTVPASTTITVDAQFCTSGFDACANQTVVTVGSNNIVVDCGAANLDLTGYWTPAFGDAAVGTANYVKFVAPATGLYEAALCGNESDSRLAVLTACGDSATFLAADDDGCTDGAAPFTSKVSWNATQGATYYVAVGCYVEAGVAFPIPPDQVLTIGEPAAPVDPCDPSQIINASIGTTIVIPDQAFPDLDMTGSACVFEFAPQAINAPKYLKFTPSVSGTFTVGNCTDTGTTADCRIAALATCGDPSTTIACDDDGCTGGVAPFTSLLTLDLVSGVTYYFAVGGYSATQVGPFTIEITGPSAPPSCFADINLDGIVNGADLGLLLGNWGATGTGDLNNDGIVNGADLGLLLGAFGVCP